MHQRTLRFVKIDTTFDVKILFALQSVETHRKVISGKLLQRVEITGIETLFFHQQIGEILSKNDIKRISTFFKIKSRIKNVKTGT